MLFILTLSGPRSIVMAMSELRKALFPLSNIEPTITKRNPSDTPMANLPNQRNRISESSRERRNFVEVINILVILFSVFIYNF